MASILEDKSDSVISRTDEITNVLKREILLGQYRPGERLPSERDLSERFQTSRGTVREALKKLEQLGVATIQPGGARVVPIEKAGLDVLGTLLDLHHSQDPNLVDQMYEVIGLLMRLAAGSAVVKASDKQLAEAILIAQQVRDAEISDQFMALSTMAFKFIEISDHLVLQLVMNGLQTQLINDGVPRILLPVLEQKPLTKIINNLLSGMKVRNAEKVFDAMTELNKLIRKSARKTFEETGTNT